MSTISSISEDRIREILTDTVEPAEPWQLIADTLDKYAGKPLTKTHLGKIQAALPVRLSDSRLTIEKSAGMTNIRFWPHGSYADSNTLLIAHKTTHVPCPSREELEERNPWAFSARKERNEQRAALLSNPEIIRKVSEATYMMETAVNALQELTAYGKPAHIVKYRVSDEMGLSQLRPGMLL